MPHITPLPSDDPGVTKPVLPEVVPTAAQDSLPQPGEDLFVHTRAWLMQVVDEAERIDADLPMDLAKNHDHYLYGSPKK